VLAIPDFRRLWIAQFVSIFGDFVALYAVFSAVSFKLHGSPREVSLITVAFLLPLAIVGPIAGVFVDRWDARRTMITSDAVRCVLALLLVFATSLWHIYAILFAISTLSAFFIPAQSVTTPMIVPREGLLSASAAMQQTVQGVRIVSPAIAGALVGWLGEHSCYYLDSASFLISALMIATIHPSFARTHLDKELKSAVEDLFSGMRFVLTHPVIGFVITSIAAGTFAVACFTALIAVYVRDILHADAYLFGALGSLIGVGMLAGGFGVVPLARRVNRKEALVLVGIVGNGLFILLIAAAGNRIVTMASCVAIGVSSAFIMVPAGALMQSEVPHEMRGRVSSSSISLVTLSQGIALLIAGDLAARFGIVSVYFGSALALFIVGIVGHARLRQRG
jgi:MFS family permease